MYLIGLQLILSLIYRDFLCSKEKKEKLLQLDLEEIRREEKILSEKYEIDFEKRKKEKIEKNIEKTKEQDEKLPIKVEKEKWYKKIFKFLKRLFKR